MFPMIMVIAGIKNSNTGSWLEAVIAVKKSLITIGSNGTILKSDKNAQDWKEKQSHTTEWLNAIAKVENNKLIIVGNNGTILISTDNGDRWQKTEAIIDEDLLAITSINNKVIVIGRKGTVLLSTDGGVIWKKYPKVDIKHDLLALTKSDKQTVIAVGNQGTIARFNLADETWGLEKSSTKNNIHSIKQINNALVAVGSGGTVLTRNNDATWNFATTCTSNSLYSVTHIGQKLVAAGANATVITSVDSKFKVFNCVTDNKNDLFSIIPLSNKKLISVGVQGVILTLSAQAKVWRQWSNQSGTLNDIITLNEHEENYLAVGWRGTILYYQRQGGWQKKWAYDKAANPVKKSLSAVVAVDKHNLVAVGEGGAIIVSKDGGLTWKKREQTITKSWLMGITSIALDQSNKSKKRLIVVGGNGVILYSDNKGDSWQAASNTIKEHLAGITQVGTHGSRLVAVGNRGTVLVSVDAGKTWQPRSSAADQYLRAVVAIGERTLVAVGGDGQIIVSSDKGESWVKYQHDNKSWLLALAVLNKKWLYIVGQANTVLKAKINHIPVLNQITLKNIDKKTARMNFSIKDDFNVCKKQCELSISFGKKSGEKLEVIASAIKAKKQGKKWQAQINLADLQASIGPVNYFSLEFKKSNQFS